MNGREKTVIYLAVCICLLAISSMLHSIFWNFFSFLSSGFYFCASVHLNLKIDLLLLLIRVIIQAMINNLLS